MKTLRGLAPYGFCECPACNSGNPSSPCGGRGPAAFEVVRDGKKLKLCTRRYFSTDKPTRKLLVRNKKELPMFIKYDALGGYVLATELNEKSKPTSKGSK